MLNEIRYKVYAPRMITNHLPKKRMEVITTLLELVQKVVHATHDSCILRRQLEKRAFIFHQLVLGISNQKWHSSRFSFLDVITPLKAMSVGNDFQDVKEDNTLIKN